MSANPPAKPSPSSIHYPLSTIHFSKRDAWALCAVLALALIPLRSFLWQTDWPTHEVHSYGVRLAALDLAARHGQWLGRWCETLDGGYGYPLFAFYAPGYYMLALLFYKAGLGLSMSWKSAVVVLQLAGAAGVYGMGRLFYGRSAAALAALLWAFLPYQQVNLFVRGAVAEYAALQWLPVCAALGLWAIRRRSLPLSIFAAGAHACLIATHTISAMTSTALLLALCVGASWHWRERTPARPLAMAAAAIALSSFYWLPAFMERQFVQTEKMVSGIMAYENHFLHWTQWFNVTYWSFGPSKPGAGDGMALHLGLAQLAAFLIAWRLALIARRRAMRRIPFPLLAGTILLVPLLFLTLPASAPFWKSAPLFHYVLFPWRLLGPAGLFMAWAAAYAIELPFAGGRYSRTERAAILAAVLAAVVISPPWHSGGVREETPLLSERPSEAEIMSQGWSITAEDEFLPKWVEKKWPEEFPAQEARTIDPSGKATVSRGANGTWLISVDQPGEGYVVLGQYWFPGWRLEQNGQSVFARPSKSYGLIEFEAPAGQSQFVLSRIRTPIQAAGDSISIATLLFCIGLLAVWVAFMRRRVSAG